jgi:O-Antigen ligase
VCAAAGAVVGTFREPPSEDSSTVGVWAINPAQLERAQVPDFGPPPLSGVSFHENLKNGVDDASIKATRANEESALADALEGATHYAQRLAAREDRWLQEAVAQEGDRRLRPVRLALLNAPARYELRYTVPSTGAGGASPPLRGALIGLLVSALAAALIAAPRRLETAPRSQDGGDPVFARSSLSPTAGIAGGVLASAGLVALGSASADLYTFLFIALLFASAFVYALRGGPRAIRNLLIAVIAIAPLRGALLALADTVDLPSGLLTFNALQPSLIAASAAAALLAHRSLLRDQSRALVACWLAIAAACVLDFATQTVGLRLYAIGLAQYLIYPTFALLAWRLLQPRDRERLVWAFIGLGVLVALSIFLEVAGVDFAEAVRSARRFGGATGSYLHAAIFLGTTAVLALGALFSRWSRQNALLTVAAVGVMVAGIGLTYSRGGFGIAVVGALVLLVALGGRNRLRLVGVTIAATAVGLALSSALGPDPGQLASRTTSGASVQGDPGNAKRIDSMKETINEWRALPVTRKAFGKGLASTGNAGKLASQEPDPTESYPLKVLVESGAAGLLLIGGVLVWAVVVFARTSRAAVDPLLKGVGAAGIGLSAEALIYPTLEVQLVSLTWWLLLVLCLKEPAVTGAATLRLPMGRRERGAEAARPSATGSREPA